jgi:hypothetical protein
VVGRVEMVAAEQEELIVINVCEVYGEPVDLKLPAVRRKVRAESAVPGTQTTAGTIPP